MTDCICEGNWRLLVKKYEPLIGSRFVDEQGRLFTFFGLVHADDDYYFGLHGKSGLQLLSCVSDLAGCGYTLARGADGTVLCRWCDHTAAQHHTPDDSCGVEDCDCDPITMIFA